MPDKLKLRYADVECDMPEKALAHLRAYAWEVLVAMQNAEPDDAPEWTACEISIDGVFPCFTFGSLKRIDPDADERLVVRAELRRKGS